MASDISESNNEVPSKNRSFITIFKKLFHIKTPGKEMYNSQAFENLDRPQQDMIKGIFELKSKNAKDIMIPRVDIIAIDSKIELKPLVTKIYKAGHSRLPVFEDTTDNIIGILYAKDLLKILNEKKTKFIIKKILHKPFFVPETMPLDELLYEFKKRRLHMAIVIDEYGGVDGMITMEDILEEIVGEIQDEFDTSSPPEIREKGDGIYDVDSRVTLFDFNKELNLNIPTEEFDTIGGFLFDLFGKIPKKNDSIEYENLQFTIKEINGTIINRISVTISKSLSE